MPSTRTSAAQAPQDLAARARRLEALETRALAARCLAGIGQLSEVILGPRARHAELLLEALLARTDPGALDELRGELLAARRELSARCAALAALERAQLETAERELVLRRELEDLRTRLESSAEREAQPRAERGVRRQEERAGQRPPERDVPREERDAQRPEEREVAQAERDALELGRAALEQIESELAALRRERDWRSAEMRAVSAALESLRFRLLAPGLQARARRWKEGAP